MQPRPQNTLLRAALLAALAWFSPSIASAESTVFRTDFSADTIHAATPVITPTSTNWYVHSSKNATSTTISSAGFNLTYAATSSAAGVEGIARFATTPVDLASVGDSITARTVFYTDKVLNLSAGFYNSGGSNPLTTLQNNGLDGTILTVTNDGTLAWKGYRARLQSGSATGVISARLPQTGATLTRSAHDVVATSTGDFSSPGPVSIASIGNSAATVTFADGLGSEYRLLYTITRTAADELTIAYTIRDASDVVLYSVSGATTLTTVPSQVTSAFDAFAIGTRNNATAGNSISQLYLTSLTITAKNSAVADIATQPVNQAWVTGQAGSVSVVASGTAPLTYQWYKDTSPLSGATSATYSVGAASAEDVGNYYVVVTNALGSSTSATVAVTVSSASLPVFTTHPATQTVNAGETLTLTAATTGAPTPTYQWFKGLDPISGATSSTYTVPAASADDAGTYTVVATNSQGPATSNAAVVTINSAAPVITTPPASVTVNVGDVVNLSVVATGYPAPTYQWFKGGIEIAGATGPSYTIATATTASAGSYTVTATNSLGSDGPSAAAVVTVNVILPTITTQPAATAATIGGAASFSVTATGSAPLSYQWYLGTTAISDANSSTYNIPSASGANIGNYSVVVTNEGGSATSNAAALTLVVNQASTAFSTNFADDVINPQSPATPTVTPTSTAWYILSSKTATSSAMVDDNPDTVAVNDPAYVLTLNGGSGSAFFQTATRFSDTPLSLTQVGSQVRVTTTFTTRNILTFGFGLYNSGGSWPKQLDFEDLALPALSRNILGSSSTTAVGAGTQYWAGYRATLSNLSGASTVGQVMLSRPPQTNSTTNQGQELCTNGSGSVSYNNPVGTSLTVTKNPTSDAAGTLTDNATYTLVLTMSRSAADAYTLSYQIYAGEGTSGTLFRSASGVASTAPAGSVLGNRPSDITQGFDAFAMGMRNAGPLAGPIPRFVLSNFKVEHILPVTAAGPEITTQPASQSVAPGANVTFTAAASGTPAPTFQWFKGVDAISGATSATYSLTSVSAGDAASYTVVATNAVGSATSSAAVLTIASASPYDTWATSYGLDPAGNGAPTANPSGDGVVNLVKFALGGSPNLAGSTTLPTVAASGGTLTFTYDVKVAATAQYNVFAQSSTDLSTWNPVVHGVGGATIATSTLDATTDHVIVTLPTSGARVFVRLRIEAIVP